MPLIDTHAHLDDEAFAGDLPAVLERAAAADVAAIVAIGTTVASSRAVVALAERYPQVRATLGIHPHEAGATPPDAVEQLRPWTGHPDVVALGETGLDYYRDRAPRTAQTALFRAHLTLAQETGLPVVIHCRDAYPDVLTVLADYPDVRCIFHAFSGSSADAAECVRRGHFLALGGPLTFPNAHRLAAAARQVPLSQIVLETDSPLLSPHPFRGRRNEPARVGLIAERLAVLRERSLHEVTAATTANARRAFRFDRVGVGA
jgi:TatD DNase family protein